MEETASLKGQLLIRSIIEEYRNLLEVLADPQLLLKDTENVPAGNFDKQNTDTKKTTQEILHKLTRLFSQLKTVYNECLDELERYSGPEMQPHGNFQNEKAIANKKFELNQDTLENVETTQLMQDVKQKNNQLKSIIDEMRQLIWDIDIMKRS